MSFWFWNRPPQDYIAKYAFKNKFIFYPSAFSLSAAGKSVAELQALEDIDINHARQLCNFCTLLKKDDWILMPVPSFKNVLTVAKITSEYIFLPEAVGPMRMAHTHCFSELFRINNMFLSPQLQQQLTAESDELINISSLICSWADCAKLSHDRPACAITVQAFNELMVIEDIYNYFFDCLNEGMTLTHEAWGEGTVKTITPAGSAINLSVDFQAIGIKNIEYFTALSSGLLSFPAETAFRQTHENYFSILRKGYSTIENQLSRALKRYRKGELGAQTDKISHLAPPSDLHKQYQNFLDYLLKNIAGE